MIPGEHKGEWFLPNGKKYPGQLIIDQDRENIQLEIYGLEFIEGEVIKIPDIHPQRFHLIILGDCKGNATLYNCHWAGCKEVGKDLYRIIYRIEFVFSGVQYKDDNTIPIHGGTFIFPHLSTWYDGSLFHEKLRGKEGLYENGKHIVQSVLANDEIKINEELSIHLWDEVKEEIEELDISYKVVFHKYLLFQYELEVSFGRLLHDAITFLKLLEFCFGKPLNFQILSTNVDRKYISDDDLHSHFTQATYPLIYVNNYTLRKKTKIADHCYHGRDMLFSRWTCSQEEMNQFIINWFRNDKFFTIYEYYLDSNNWMQGTDAVLSNVMFNNRFLNLIQALEDYYRVNCEATRTKSDRELFDKMKTAIINQIKDSSLKNWLDSTYKFSKFVTLEEKLATIIAKFNNDLSKLFHDISLTEFPKSSSKFRNELSHAKSKEINQGIRLHEDYYIAQVLLGTCILKTLGMNNIIERIAYYSRFENAAKQIVFIQHQRLSS